MDKKLDNLIRNDRFKEAIDHRLNSNFNLIGRIYFLILSARLERLKRDYLIGTISYADYSREKNRIGRALSYEPLYVKFFRLKYLLWFTLISMIIIVAWSFFDEPKLVFSKIELIDRKKNIVKGEIQHEANLFTNAWFHLTNSNYLKWMDKRYFKIGEDKPRLITNGVFQFHTEIAPDQKSINLKIIKGNNEAFILNDQTFEIN